MDSVINDFVRVLRRHQLRVSPAESLDALHALQQVGLGERKVVRDALRATMVKNQEDSETFDRLFDLFFSIRPPKEKPAASFKLPEHDHDHGPPKARRPKKRVIATMRASRSTCATFSTRSGYGPPRTSTARPRGCGSRCSRKS